MLTGDVRNQVDVIWNFFWTGGISNPSEVIEQITYLLFLKRLDDLHTLEENKATRLKRPLEQTIFPPLEERRPPCAITRSIADLSDTESPFKNPSSSDDKGNRQKDDKGN